MKKDWWYGRRDGTVYGCGLTEHGQLPFLRFSKSGGADSSSSSEDEGARAAPASARGDGAHTRNEITIPTRLRLPFVQVRALASHPLLLIKAFARQSRNILSCLRVEHEVARHQMTHATIQRFAGAGRAHACGECGCRGRAQQRVPHLCT